MLKHSLNFKKTVLLFFLLLLLLYAVLFLNTNSVMRYAKSVFRGEISSEEITDTPLYTRYYPKDPETVKVDLSLKRIFVAHNFKDGYIWVKYDEEQLDSYENIVSGSWDIISRWKIHKENGEWKVVDIKEHP